MAERLNGRKIAMQVASGLGLLLCVLMGIWFWRAGLLSSQEVLRSFVGSFGVAGALVFIVFQAVQVVVPVLPGGLGCLAGVVLFGPWQGFLYNYIGICAGSLAAFAIARNCGRPLLYQMFPKKLIERYDGWAKEKDRFARWFAFLIFIPVAPDDYLCFLAGTTEIAWKKYTAIILLCKPFSIALYSLGLTMLFQNILGLWR
ncbi:MAG: TVP38/TMEM64 family protein [Pygmaiobacter sp.]|nr:TVP38/TMEM64 family protein [Pygmaiobacter sp.]